VRERRAADRAGQVLTELELSRAAQKAVALAQQEKSTWTRADVIKHLGRVLPRSGDERETLVRWSRRSASAQNLARRCRIVLGCADGKTIRRSGDLRDGWLSRRRRTRPLSSRT
jgi:hypothetical protein